MATSALTEKTFLDELRQQVEDTGSLSLFAARAGVSKQMLSKVLAGKIPPSMKIADAMEYERVFAFVPKGRKKAVNHLVDDPGVAARQLVQR